ncbi:MAG: beta-1,3-glucanase family protein [Candidatus Brocadiales bacterium]|nr:beta-1,3-glucanase family protein [Candidatus Bathyanammoxibius amoris]
MNKTFKKIINGLIPTAILVILAVVVVVLSQPVELVEAQNIPSSKLTAEGEIAPLTPTPDKLTAEGKIAPLTPTPDKLTAEGKIAPLTSTPGKLTPAGKIAAPITPTPGELTPLSNITADDAQASSSNTLSIDNQSGKVLYISVKRADNNKWLDFSTNPPTWGSTTLGPNNRHKITGSTDSISLIDPGIKSGNVFVTTFVPTGVPSLTSTQIWDFFEYNTGGIWDISAVDAVGIPMALEFKTRKTGWRDIPRDFIMGKFVNLPSPFNSPGAIIRDGGTIVRALAPTQAGNKNYLPSNTTVLDNAMDVGFPQFITNSQGLSISSGQWTFTDFSWDSSSRSLSFKANGTKFTIGGGTGKNAFSSINVISTAMTEPNNAAGRFIALIETAINRGVLYNPRLWGQNDKTFGGIAGFPWNYYQDIEGSNANQYNRYSETVHQWSINGRNYGLAHDDLYKRSSSITIPPGEPVILHIWKFTGSDGSTPITWPNHNYLTTLGIPPQVITNLGFVYVNKNQQPEYVIPDTVNNIPSVGLPQFTDIQFSKHLGKLLNIDIVNRKVLNPNDWENGAGVLITKTFFQLVFPADFGP